MSEKHRRERRKYFRLRYPFTYAFRPKLLCLTNGTEADITELSEGGLRCLAGQRWPIGLTLHGLVHFTDDNEDFEIVGIVIRHQGEEVVLRTPRGVSWQRMLIEQRKLLKLYPLLHHTAPSQPVVLKPAK